MPDFLQNFGPGPFSDGGSTAIPMPPNPELLAGHKSSGMTGGKLTDSLPKALSMLIKRFIA
jgi:hypothetical protein